MNEPKRHHYLPKCYLERFVNDDGKLAIYDRVRNTYRSQSADNTGFEKYLYSWNLPDGTKDQSLERQFGLIETHFTPILSELEQGKLLLPEQTDPLIAFIALQTFRPPAILKDIETLGTVAMAKHRAELRADEKKYRDYIVEIFGEDSPEAKLPFDKFDSVIEELESRTSFKNVVLRMLLIHSRDAYGFLAKKSAITIVHAPPGKCFITSDRPVLVHKADPSALGIKGFLGPGSRIFMPLSKRIGINLGDGPTSIFHSEISRDDLNKINLEIARFSFSLLLSDSEQRLKFIVNKSGLATRPIYKSIGKGGSDRG